MTPSQLLATEVPGPLVVVWLKGVIDVENEEKNKYVTCPGRRRDGTVPSYFCMERLDWEMAIILVLEGSCDLTAKKTVKHHLPSNRGDLFLLLFCGFLAFGVSPFFFIRFSNPTATHGVWHNLKCPVGCCSHDVDYLANLVWN